MTTPERWYVLSTLDTAWLCLDEADAMKYAAQRQAAYPANGPYRVALLGDVTAERAEIARLRQAIERACAGYPADDCAPTCVAILRAGLGPNVRTQRDTTA